MSADPQCKKCGAGETEHSLCPERPYMQANVGSHGWRRVPNRVRDCIEQQEAAVELAGLIHDAYERFRNADSSTPLGRHEKFAALHEGARIVREFPG